MHVACSNVPYMCAHVALQMDRTPYEQSNTAVHTLPVHRIRRWAELVD